MDTLPRQATDRAEPVYADGLLQVVRPGCPACLGPPAVLRLAGDVDASNVTRLAHVLSVEVNRPVGPSGPPSSMHLDLSALQFMDVGGMRLLMHTALAMFGDGERRLVLHALAPHLRRAMQVVGWDRTPGLDIALDGPYGVHAHLAS